MLQVYTSEQTTDTWVSVLLIDWGGVYYFTDVPLEKIIQNQFSKTTSEQQLLQVTAHRKNTADLTWREHDAVLSRKKNNYYYCARLPSSFFFAENNVEKQIPIFGHKSWYFQEYRKYRMFSFCSFLLTLTEGQQSVLTSTPEHTLRLQKMLSFINLSMYPASLEFSRRFVIL